MSQKATRHRVADSGDAFTASRRAQPGRKVLTRASADSAEESSLRFDAMASRRILAQLPADDNAELWRQMAENPDVGVRQLVAAQGPSSVWLKLAGDGSPWVRQAVARRVAASPEHRDLAHAQRLDAVHWVRLAAVEGLAGQAHGAELLCAYLEDAAPLVRASALQALPPSVPNAAIAALAVHDPVDWVQHVALRVLAQRDPQAARQAFRQIPAARQGTLVSVLRLFAPSALQRAEAALMHCAFDKLLLPLDTLAPQVLADLLQHSQRQHQPVESKRAALLSKAVRGWQHPALLRSEAPYEHALFLLHQPQHADIIGRQLRDADLPQLEGALSVVEMLRTAENPYARRMAAHLLSRLPEVHTAVPMLQALILDPDGTVRQDAATALSELCVKSVDPAACITAARHLAASPEQALRLRGIRMLTRIATAETVPALVEAFHNDPQHLLRVEALRGLVDHPSLDTLPLLREAASDPQPEVRARLAEFLEKASLVQAYGLLATLVEDPSPEVREITTHTLCVHAKGPDDVVSEAALRLLDSADARGGEPNPVVTRLRSTVLPMALERFQDKPFVRAMLHGWVERLDAVHVDVLNRLATSDYPDRIALLTLLLDSPHPEVAGAARRALEGRLRAVFARQEGI